MPILLQINVVSNMLSTGKITEDISKVVQSQGWTSYVAFGRWAKPGISRNYQIGPLINTYLHYAEHRLLDHEGLSSRLSTRRLIRWIKDIKPDIIHLHVIHDHYLNYPLLFEFLSSVQIPIVWTQHDCWAFTGGCMFFDLYGCEMWKAVCINCKEKRALLSDCTYKQYNLKKKYFSRTRNLTLVPVSNWMESCLRQSFLRNSHIVRIYNGIDLNKFSPRPNLKLPNSIFRILGVAGVWHKRKGLDDFLKLREILPDNFEITLVGLTEEQIHKLPSGINGIERTFDTEELVSLYSKSDVYVNPTYSDNFPTTNIEALACGTPVITYQTGGSPEAIDSLTGVVIAQGDVEALAEAIRQMCRIPLSAENCRRRAEQLFDKNNCFNEYVKLYNSILSDQNNGKNGFVSIR